VNLFADTPGSTNAQIQKYVAINKRLSDRLEEAQEENEELKERIRELEHELDTSRDHDGYEVIDGVYVDD
jgi:hypothetical protein